MVKYTFPRVVVGYALLGAPTEPDRPALRIRNDMKQLRGIRFISCPHAGSCWRDKCRYSGLDGN